MCIGTWHNNLLLLLLLVGAEMKTRMGKWKRNRIEFSWNCVK